ncbi:DNRLRE domain-containing protein [Rudanella lutea]|uniref:DNRLRE domain-containing protein n=1 Tax=Rudanella lutea TaxID=451374 RepID=UPI00036DA6A3|nr:DNRLRE domain-containing protein [Rudanella lutea]
MKQHVRTQRWIGLILLLWGQSVGVSFGQAGIPDPTSPGGSTAPAGATVPGSSTATGWLRLNGRIGINNSDPRSSLHVSAGDVYIDNIGSGVIMRSPNGYCWRVTVDNTGNFVRTRIACPGEPALASEMLTLQPATGEGQDAFTSTYSTTAVTGAGYGMAVGAWTTDGTPLTYQSYLRFNLSAIPATARIDSAFLRLTYYDIPWFAPSPNTGNNPVYLQRVTSAWDQTTLNYATRPTSTTAGQIAVPSAESQPGVYQKLDVKSQVASMVANPATNFGWLLRLQDESPAPPYRALQFCTSEHPTPANRPRLVVYYSL